MITRTAYLCATLRPLWCALAIACAAGCGDDESSGSPARTALPTASATALSTAAFTATASAVPSATATTAAPSATATPATTATPTDAPTVPPTPRACADLAGALIAGATLSRAEVVPADHRDPELCLIGGRIETINFELRLPRGWNGKIVMLGGGGFDGTIPSPDVVGSSGGMLADGYATIGTDSGHSGSVVDASWALDDPVAIENYAFRAWHTVLLAARQIVAAHYAAPPLRVYFHGGSSGGREALIMAQRWPDDYDGVVARAPALSFVAILLNANRIVKHVHAPDGYLPAATVAALDRAVLALCDASDNLVDGMVSNVEGCHFDAERLRCGGPPDETCLSDAQYATVQTVHTPLPLPFPLAHGIDEYPRYPVGGEASPSGWPLWITGFGPTPPSSLLFMLSDGFVKYFVSQDPDADSFAFAPIAYRERLQSLSALLDATDPDLSRFAARGGKVILWHGWGDYALSAYSTVAYYREVVAAAGGQAAADIFVRFYTSPGIDHLNAGAGAPLFDLLGALDDWVEDGTAPGDLVAYKLLPPASEPIAYRPLCRYPTYARYVGGDPNQSTSFTCAAP